MISKKPGMKSLLSAPRAFGLGRFIPDRKLSDLQVAAFMFAAPGFTFFGGGFVFIV
jgi:hypothetical protein